MKMILRLQKSCSSYEHPVIRMSQQGSGIFWSYSSDALPLVVNMIFSSNVLLSKSGSWSTNTSLSYVSLRLGR